MDDRNTDVDVEEMETLVTRASIYSRELGMSSSTSNQMISKSSIRNSAFLKCKEHMQSKNWTDINSACSNCLKYSVNCEHLSNGILPRGKDVLSYLLSLKCSNSGKSVNSIHDCAMDLVLHWIYCNIYPISIAAVKKRIIVMFEKYNKLKRYPQKKKGHTFMKNLDEFIKSQNTLFDIIGK